jgi:ParB/RepB/Spo0J family partition protein
LVESIRRNGVYDPLVVRTLAAPGPDGKSLQILRGHRRQIAAKAAGRDRVPIRNLGVVPDDLAYDIVAIDAYGSEPLTPLEEGGLVATWLDEYGEDAKAVAAKLGKTERWVRLHAQIDRGLIPAWKEAAVAGPEQKNRYGHAGAAREDFRKWTAAHWVLIARLPAKQQEYWLEKIRKDYRFDPHDATVEEVEGWLTCEKLLLAKAPFDAAACEGCDRRTDSISQLLWEEPDAKDTGAVRCLDGKCWERRAAKGRKEEFRVLAEAAVEKSNSRVPDPVPISMMEEPEGWSGRQEYAEKIKPVRKAFGKALVESGRIAVVKEGDKGAVPGIVVAGRGKGMLRWVRISEPTKDSGRGGQRKPTAGELAKEARAKEKAARWDMILKAAFAEISKADRPVSTAVILCCLRAGAWPSSAPGFDKETKKLWAGLLDAHKAGTLPEAVILILEASWSLFRAWAREKSRYCYVDGDLPRLRDIAPLFGIDPDARYQALAAKEEKPESKIKNRKS